MKTSLNNNKGQSIFEYLILSVLIGIFCLGAVQSLGKRVNKRFDQIKTKVVKQLKVEF